MVNNCVLERANEVLSQIKHGQYHEDHRLNDGQWTDVWVTVNEDKEDGFFVIDKDDGIYSDNYRNFKTIEQVASYLYGEVN